MEKAILVNKTHFRIKEVNYSNLKKYYNNIILEYTDEIDNKYFRRSLFELSRLDFNIGIILSLSNIELKSFINDIKGFDIKLGIWIYGSNKISYFNQLSKDYHDNFITGVVSNPYISNIPRWGDKGDIETTKFVYLDFIDGPISELEIHTDYKTIYEENNLKPIPSTYNM